MAGTNKAHIVYIDDEGIQAALSILLYLGTVADDSARDAISPVVPGNIVAVLNSAEANNTPAIYMWDGSAWVMIGSGDLAANFTVLINNFYTKAEVDAFLLALGIRGIVANPAALAGLTSPVVGQICSVTNDGDGRPALYMYSAGSWVKVADPDWNTIITNLATSVGSLDLRLQAVEYWQTPVANMAALNAVIGMRNGEMRLVKSDIHSNPTIYKYLSASGAWTPQFNIPFSTNLTELNTLRTAYQTQNVQNAIYYSVTENAFYVYNWNTNTWGPVTGSSLSDYIRRDGTLDFLANQSMGGFKLTNLLNGSSTQDAVAYGQLTSAVATLNATISALTTTAIAEGTNLYFTEARVRSSVLVGFSATNSAISAADSVLSALGKAQGQINALITAGGTYQLLSEKNTQNGYVGIADWDIVFYATGSTGIKSYMRNSNTAERTYLFQNRSGTIADDTDLAAKEPTIAAGISAQYWRGDKTWQTLNTSAVPEGTNLYYTDVRADARITLQRNAANGIAGLDSSGKLFSSQLPALAISDTFVVGSQAAMLALSTAEVGDIAVRTDVSKSFILTGSGSPPVLADWQELLSPTGAVASVNGYTGTVVLTTTDIAEGTNLYFTNGRATSAMTGAISAITTSNLTASTAVVTNGSGKIVSATATATEVGYLVGVTSSIQTQLNTLSGGSVTSVSGTTNRITSSGGLTPTIDIAAIYVGQTSITTLGTITTGVWNGTAIANANLANSAITINGTSASLGASRTLVLASSDFANEGTTTQVLHGNAAGNPTWGAIVNADITSVAWSKVTSTPTSLAGYGILDAIALTSGSLAQFASTTSAQLATLISDETGSGALVFATSPTLVTPVLGVASITTLNGLTITSSTGTLTITNGKTLSCSNTLTFTGTDSSSVAFGTGGTVAYVANKLSVFAATTSAELAGVISDETGSGLLVFATSPTLTTPVLGVATATSINKVTITAPTTSATLTLVDGSSLITAGAFSITFTSTATTSVTLPTTGTLATLAGTETFTNKRITQRVQAVSDAATITPNADSDDCVDITAIAQAFTMAAPSGTPTNFQKLWVRIKDNGTARAITWNSIYAAGGVSLPTTTVLSKILNLGFVYNTANALNKWQLVASAQEA